MSSITDQQATENFLQWETERYEQQLANQTRWALEEQELAHKMALAIQIYGIFQTLSKDQQVVARAAVNIITNFLVEQLRTERILKKIQLNDLMLVCDILTRTAKMNELRPHPLLL